MSNRRISVGVLSDADGQHTFMAHDKGLPQLGNALRGVSCELLFSQQRLAVNRCCENNSCRPDGVVDRWKG